jgi:hypothetical protein
MAAKPLSTPCDKRKIATNRLTNKRPGIPKGANDEIHLDAWHDDGACADFCASCAIGGAR